MPDRLAQRAITRTLVHIEKLLSMLIIAPVIRYRSLKPYFPIDLIGIDRYRNMSYTSDLYARHIPSFKCVNLQKKKIYIYKQCRIMKRNKVAIANRKSCWMRVGGKRLNEAIFTEEKEKRKGRRLKENERPSGEKRREPLYSRGILA